MARIGETEKGRKTLLDFFYEFRPENPNDFVQIFVLVCQCCQFVEVRLAGNNNLYIGIVQTWLLAVILH